jgi:hypothetical protein
MQNNCGTGAGGANTNHFGKIFETNTCNESRLEQNGFVKTVFTKRKYDLCLSKKDNDKTITYVTQTGLKYMMKRRFSIQLFRYPDEAYLIEHEDGKRVLKILEKKEQRVDGSVETKLWSGQSLKREYEMILGNRFVVDYGFCVSGFLQKKIMSAKPKYETLKKILAESGIVIMFGEDDNYFSMLDAWITDVGV